MGRGLGWGTHRGPLQPQTFCDSVTLGDLAAPQHLGTGFGRTSEHWARPSTSPRAAGSDARARRSSLPRTAAPLPAPVLSSTRSLHPSPRHSLLQGHWRAWCFLHRNGEIIKFRVNCYRISISVIISCSPLQGQRPKESSPVCWHRSLAPRLHPSFSTR